MKRVSLWKVLGIVMVLSCTIALTACNGTTNDVNNNGNTDDGQVAGASQQLIYGYILEINPQARVALIDQIELISYSDTERIDALHLDRKADFINGYHIYNSSTGSRLYPLASSVNLSLSDFVYSNSSAYNSMWNNSAGSSQGMTSDLTNNNGGAANDADNDGSPLTVEGGFMDTTPNDNDENNLQGDTLLEEITENDQSNNTNEENLVDGTANNTGINHSSGSVYSGTELSRLNDRLEMYEHIPFLITLENGRVVKIEEMDSLFH